MGVMSLPNQGLELLKIYMHNNVIVIGRHEPSSSLVHHYIQIHCNATKTLTLPYSSRKPLMGMGRRELGKGRGDGGF